MPYSSICLHKRRQRPGRRLSRREFQVSPLEVKKLCLKSSAPPQHRLTPHTHVPTADASGPVPHEFLRHAKTRLSRKHPGPGGAVALPAPLWVPHYSPAAWRLALVSICPWQTEEACTSPPVRAWLALGRQTTLRGTPSISQDGAGERSKQPVQATVKELRVCAESHSKTGSSRHTLP